MNFWLEISSFSGSIDNQLIHRKDQLQFENHQIFLTYSIVFQFEKCTAAKKIFSVTEISRKSTIDWLMILRFAWWINCYIWLKFLICYLEIIDSQNYPKHHYSNMLILLKNIFSSFQLIWFFARQKQKMLTCVWMKKVSASRAGQEIVENIEKINTIKGRFGNNVTFLIDLKILNYREI